MRALLLSVLLLPLLPSAAADDPPAVVQVAPQGTVEDARPVLRAVFADDVGVDPNFTRLLLDGSPLDLEVNTAEVARGRPRANLVEGIHRASVEVRDTAGHVVNRSWTFLVRLPEPRADEAAVLSVALTEGFYRDVPPVRVSFRGSSLEATLDGRTVQAAVTGDEARIDLDASEGPHTLLLVARGANETEARREIRFSVDRTPPEVAFIDTFELPDAVTVSWREASRVRLESAVVELDGKALDATLGEGGGRIDIPDVAHGRHEIRVAVTDLAGNTGEATRTFVVDDGLSPEAGPLTRALYGDDGRLGWGGGIVLVVIALALSGMLIAARPR